MPRSPNFTHRLGQRTHTAALRLRYQHATAERHKEIADRLGALLRADTSGTEPVAAVVAIAPR